MTRRVVARSMMSLYWAAELTTAFGMQVNHETFHRMLEEYRDAKKREHELDLKSKQ